MAYGSHYSCLVASQLCSFIISDLVKSHSLRRRYHQCWWLQSTRLPEQLISQKHDVSWPLLLCMKWSKSHRKNQHTQRSFSLFLLLTLLQFIVVAGFFFFLYTNRGLRFLLPWKIKIRAPMMNNQINISSEFEHLLQRHGCKSLTEDQDLELSTLLFETILWGFTSPWRSWKGHQMTISSELLCTSILS